MANDNTISFATITDYENRYGEVAESDKTRTETILQDASDILLGTYEEYNDVSYESGLHPLFDNSACAVTCAVAHRSLSVPAGFEGANQFSQTAGSYNASITFSNPTGYLYLSKTELKRLGLSGQTIGAIMPIISKSGDEEC